MRLLHGFVVGVLSTWHPVQASLVHVEAQADYTGTNPMVLTIIPFGTTVTASVTFDVSPGLPFLPPQAFFSNGSGMFTWENAGPQVFAVSDVALDALSHMGIVTLRFSGTGPTIGEVTAEVFNIQFDIGTNPFESKEQMLDLMLNSTVSALRVGAQTGLNTRFDDIDRNVSGTITPGPPTLALMALAGMGWTVHQRRKGGGPRVRRRSPSGLP